MATVKPDLTYFYDTPCKFKLVSGKEVYGVIWRRDEHGRLQHYFASPFEYRNYRRQLAARGPAADGTHGTPVDIEQFVAAEILEGVQY
ncbi:MAG: hypothetical protein AAGB22_07515 [Bacteroidota bacterium]